MTHFLKILDMWPTF